MSDGNTKTVAPDVPIHGGRQIGPPLFYKILEQLGIDEKRFGQGGRGLTRDRRGARTEPRLSGPDTRSIGVGELELDSLRKLIKPSTSEYSGPRRRVFPGYAVDQRYTEVQ